MWQVRFHGRGGQGAVSGAEILSIAAFLEGKYAQAFPSFGSERNGAPVMAFCRIDDREIRLREPVLEPDVLVVQDATLFHAIDVFAGLTNNGYVLINTSRSMVDLGITDAVQHQPAGHVCTVRATELALQYIKQPKPNMVLLGALAAVTGLVTIDAVVRAIQEKFSGQVGDANITAAKAAYASVTSSA